MAFSIMAALILGYYGILHALKPLRTLSGSVAAEGSSAAATADEKTVRNDCCRSSKTWRHRSIGVGRT